ncbi:hypothetical protein Hanom_Chr06g00515151 [Helianthus anomalus]
MHTHILFSQCRSKATNPTKPKHNSKLNSKAQNKTKQNKTKPNLNQRFTSAGNGRLNPPRRFIYCLGRRFVTALIPLTSFPSTGFPLVTQPESPSSQFHQHPSHHQQIFLFIHEVHKN